MSSFKCIPHSCDRAREWISLETDGELSAFEQALLAAHVARCPDCEAYQAGVAGSTSLLRAAPLEPLSEPLRLPSTTRSRYGLQRVLAPMAVAAVIVLAAISASTRLPGGSQPFHPAGPALGGLPNADLIQQRKERSAELSASVSIPTTPGGPQLADVTRG